MNCLCKPNRPSESGATNGQTFYFARATEDRLKPEATFWKIPTEGGTAQSMGFSTSYINHMAVSPDGRQLAFGDGPRMLHEYWILANLDTAFGKARN